MIFTFSGDIQTSHPASTETSKRKDNALAWSISLAAVLLLVVIVIVIICNWRKEACQQRILEIFCANSSDLPTTDRSQSSGSLFFSILWFQHVNDDYLQKYTKTLIRSFYSIFVA